MKKVLIPITITISILIIFLILIILGVFKSYTKYQDIKYGGNERNTLNLYIPKNYKGNGLILYIHGGAWITGDKEVYDKECIKYAKIGYATATINYRYTSEDVTCMDILDDIDKAVSVIKETSANLGFDLQKMLLTGHSAGAHLSLLYAYKYQYSAKIKPVAVASFAGPTDLLDETYYQNIPDIYKLFSNMIGVNFTKDTIDLVKDKLLEISPISYVNSDTIPTIIAQGELDEIVNVNNGLELEKLLKDNNITYYAYFYPNSTHALENDKEINNEVKDKFNEFINTYLK